LPVGSSVLALGDSIHAKAAGYRASSEGLAATLRSTGFLKH
jgi:lysophospholipase L1-like esterase